MEQTLEATSDVMTARSPSFRMPYAIAGPLAALAIAIATWCFGQSEQVLYSLTGQCKRKRSSSLVCLNRPK